jgi:hypothetical protein
VKELVAKYYDKKRKDKIYLLGEKVLLFMKYIRLRCVLSKLLDRFLGPFTIVKRIDINAYRLELLAKYRWLHYIFYILLLELYYR